MSRDPRLARNITPYALSKHSGTSDLFSVNPIRRSAVAVGVCGGMIALPYLVLHGQAQESVALLTTWLGLPGLILCLPVLLLSLLEEAWQRLQRRIWPTVDQLDLPPRLHNILRRHGFVTIASVEEAPDAALILLSNMDARAVHVIRRAISLWRYRRWQERGFRGTR